MLDDRFEIEQMLEANSWYAVYQSSGDDIILLPLVCWALIHDIETDSQSICGIVNHDEFGMTTATDVDGFSGYERLDPIDFIDRSDESINTLSN